MIIRKIPKCPLCKESRNVGAINSYISKKVQRTYFCSNCLVEFNWKGTLYPPLYEEKRVKKETSQIVI